MTKYVALDVHYDDALVRAAAVFFDDPKSSVPVTSAAVTSSETAAPYEPGNFKARELRPLLEVLSFAAPNPIDFDVAIVDSHVWVGEALMGLGAVLSQAIGGKAVVGIAKRRLRGAPYASVLRGKSQSPLFVSAVGLGIPAACDLARALHGEHRIPTLLKTVDHIARGFIRASFESRV